MLSDIEVFETAAARMVNYGHVKKIWQRGYGQSACYCIGGIVGSTAYGHSDEELFSASGDKIWANKERKAQDFDRLMDIFQEANGLDVEHSCKYMDWNDAETTTKQDVVDALNKTVEYLKEQK